MVAELRPVVVGGGAAGSVMALLLADRGLVPALVERQPPRVFAADKPPGRTVALSARSRELLERIGVWDELAPHRAAVLRMRVWDEVGGGSVEFSAADGAAAQEALAWIVPDDWLVECLWRSIGESPIEVHRPAAIRSFRPGPSGARVELDRGKWLDASLVVAADGARSTLRHWAGISCSEHDTGQSLVVTSIRTSRAHDNLATQVFARTGPAGLLPCAEPHWRSLIWSVPSEAAEELAQLPAEDFCRRVETLFDGSFGQCEQVAERRVVPAIEYSAESFAADGLALIGDAARSMHPLAGQGLNLALADAAALAELLPADRPPSQRELRRYARRRWCQHALMGTAVDGFLTLFAPQYPQRQRVKLQHWLRGVGMRATTSLPWMRRALVAVASGRGIGSLL